MTTIACTPTGHHFAEGQSVERRCQCGRVHLFQYSDGQAVVDVAELVCEALPSLATLETRVTEQDLTISALRSIVAHTSKG